MYWEMKLIYILFYFKLIQHYSKALKLKPTMVGEPLNPYDYENGLKLVIDPELAKDTSINDGTFNDIIKRKKHYFRTLDNDDEDTGTVKWPNGILPYLLDDKFTENDRAMVSKGLQLIESISCVKIIPRTTEENYILVRKNIQSNGCSSSVGMEGGKQTLNLAERCIQRFGSTSHEFMHALGFEHEQSRIDRDKYVAVHFENIDTDEENNFAKEDPPYANLGATYDYLSITHYSSYAFSNNGKETIVRLDGGSNSLMGQRENLTVLDIKKLNIYYNCKNKLRSYDGDESDIHDSDGSILNGTRKTSQKGVCIDFDESNCEWWANYGYCLKSPVFMSVYCKKTCNKCDMGCLDMNKKCRLWASKKYCSKYSHYMDHYCAYSCGHC